MGEQRRHEAPEVGDAIVRMMRGLVTRAGEGDTEAVEQLDRVAQLAPLALTYGMREAHARGYSHTELGRVLGITRQAARQRVERPHPGVTSARWWPSVHQLEPGHDRRTCVECARP